MQNFLFTSDIFRGSRYEKGHPLDMDRVWPSVELIKLMGWVKEDQIINWKDVDYSSDDPTVSFRRSMEKNFRSSLD